MIPNASTHPVETPAIILRCDGEDGTTAMAIEQNVWSLGRSHKEPKEVYYVALQKIPARVSSGYALSITLVSPR
jgi:hypothetical protein